MQELVMKKSFSQLNCAQVNHSMVKLWLKRTSSKIDLLRRTKTQGLILFSRHLSYITNIAAEISVISMVLHQWYHNHSKQYIMDKGKMRTKVQKGRWCNIMHFKIEERTQSMIWLCLCQLIATCSPHKPGQFHEIGTEIFGISSKITIGREEIWHFKASCCQLLNSDLISFPPMPQMKRKWKKKEQMSVSVCGREHNFISTMWTETKRSKLLSKTCTGGGVLSGVAPKLAVSVKDCSCFSQQN